MESPYARANVATARRGWSKEAHLWIKRGGAPSRLQLTKLFFAGAEAGAWHIETKTPHGVDESADGAEETEVYCDAWRRLYFFPKRDEDLRAGEAAGYYLLAASEGETPGAYGDDRLELYRVLPTDVARFFPRPTEAKMQRLTEHHPRSPADVRLVDGKWAALVSAKRAAESSEARREFLVERATRQRAQTTGAVEGEWI